MKKAKHKKRETKEERAIREAKLLEDLGLELKLDKTIRTNLQILMMAGSKATV